jgi:SNF2 family DNA or RNA helicase
MAWASIDPSGPHLAIGCAKAEQHLCLQIPGCNVSRSDGIWRCPLSWGSYVAFRCSWREQPVEESPVLAQWAASQWQDVLIAYELRSRMDAGERVLTELSEIEGAQRLFPFQRGGVSWLVTQKRAALTDPRGNGKSPQLIRAFQVLRMRGVKGPALIVAPPPAVREWARKLDAWAPELTVRTVYGTALRRRQALEEPADVYVIGWPTLRFHTRLAAYPSQAFVRCPEHGGTDDRVTPGRCEVHPKELNGIAFSVIIPDEAHRMKDARSKQTRGVWWLAGEAEYFWPATGTISAETIADVWPILHGIDPKDAPARSRYLDLYAEKRLQWHGGAEILGLKPETERFYHTAVQPTMRRIPRELARPQQPPLLPPEFRYPEMTPAQAKLYRQVKREFLADIDGRGTMVPDNAVVRFSRLCQLAGATIDLGDGEDADGFTKQRVKLCRPSNKADDILDFLEDNPGPLVVAANSPQLVALCREKLHEHKITSTAIIGGMNYDQQDAAQQAFQNGDVQVIFITAAGSEAIDLFRASVIYFAQPDPSFMSRDQKVGRVDRMGQQYAVRQVYAITPGTVDKRLYDLGCEKEERANQVTRDFDLMRWIVQGDDNDGTASTGAAERTGLGADY